MRVLKKFCIPVNFIPQIIVLLLLLLGTGRLVRCGFDFPQKPYQEKFAIFKNSNFLKICANPFPEINPRKLSGSIKIPFKIWIFPNSKLSQNFWLTSLPLYCPQQQILLYITAKYFCNMVYNLRIHYHKTINHFFLFLLVRVFTQFTYNFRGLNLKYINKSIIPVTVPYLL